MATTVNNNEAVVGGNRSMIAANHNETVIRRGVKLANHTETLVRWGRLINHNETVVSAGGRA